MPPLTLYSTASCSSCARAKALLDKRGIPYAEVKLDRDEVSRERLMGLTGLATFPQVVVGDHVIGGFDQLREADRAGRLAALVEDD